MPSAQRKALVVSLAAAALARKQNLGEVMRGPAGKDGESIVGPKGDPGNDGQSIVGPRGPQGERGDPGESIVGPRGLKGDTGDRGERGPKGERGLRGFKGERGRDGDKGDPGRDGKDGSGFTWRREWVNGEQYEPDDVVGRAGSAFICIESHRANPNNAPERQSDKWDLLAARGAPGVNGSSASGGVVERVVHVAATNYTITDDVDTVACILPVTITLPAVSKKRFTVKNYGTDDVTIVTPGAQLVERNADLTLNIDLFSVDLEQLPSGDWMVV